ncbi:HNH endonuclease signature motif containing protein [Microcella humidisoli]|uniref:HNH endonuclease n=1 Tax=Microcella humidisoli TaxID=2963406 RepID=A0ABY5G106_9MICO|nr:HNH endonuclease signature motif containing protein [Microcella humidisoli]UTT63815.1 HNH endonuclease [Microcella humidisoli]
MTMLVTPLDVADAPHDAAPHDAAGHDAAGHDAAGHDTAGHDAAGHAVGGALSAAVDALTRVPRELDLYRSLGDDALLALTRVAADEVRLAQLHVSLLAGEIARRSAPELGSEGLAQRTGHRTPDELVRVTTGTRVADARAAVRVGAAMAGADAGPLGVDGEAQPGSTVGSAGGSAGGSTPTSALGIAVLEGRVSVAVADAVRLGLGSPSPALTAEMLDAAAEQLLPRVAELDADRAAREARAMRDDLDLLGLPEREEARRAQRSFRLGRRADGMGYAHWVLDPETFAIVSDVYDRVTSPKRSMPSFDDGAPSAAPSPSAADTSTGAGASDLDDDRTPEQRASDTIAELLRQGVAADTSQLLGDAPIGVRVIVAARALDARQGRGFLEGQPDAVSIATVERLACSTGTVTLTVDGHPDNAGQPLNLGRERRLFSRAQRVALAARDGGCRWPGCERPPSWCEAHHIEHWQRDGGRTDVADGILLCRHHHLLAHNNGWEIRRDGPRYLLVPPDDGRGPEIERVRDRRSDEIERVREMPTRSRALLDALNA